MAIVSIPLASHTISVLRSLTNEDVDGYDEQPKPITIFANVRAVLSPPTSSTRLVGGERVVNNSQLRCDPIDLQPQDVVDDGRGTQWAVLDVSQISAVGLVFTTATLRIVSGNT